MTETKDVCWSASRKRGFWELPAGLWLRQVGYRGSGNGHRGWRIPATFPERRSALRVRVLPERHTLFLHVFRRTLFYPATALSLRSWCSGVLESSVQASGEDDVEAHALYPFVSFSRNIAMSAGFQTGRWEYPSLDSRSKGLCLNLPFGYLFMGVRASSPLSRDLTNLVVTLPTAFRRCVLGAFEFPWMEKRERYTMMFSARPESEEDKGSSFILFVFWVR